MSLNTHLARKATFYQNLRPVANTPAEQSESQFIQEMTQFAQIDALFQHQWEQSQAQSAKANVPFALDGYSHFSLGEHDRVVFLAQLKARLPARLFGVLNLGAKGFHVETTVEVLNVFTGHDATHSVTSALVEDGLFFR
jgi:hypothetical protein